MIIHFLCMCVCLPVCKIKEKKKWLNIFKLSRNIFHYVYVSRCLPSNFYIAHNACNQLKQTMSRLSSLHTTLLKMVLSIFWPQITSKRHLSSQVQIRYAYDYSKKKKKDNRNGLVMYFEKIPSTSLEQSRNGHSKEREDNQSQPGEEL